MLAAAAVLGLPSPQAAPALEEAETIVSAEVDRAEITVGGRLTLTVTIEHPPDVKVEWPAGDDKLGSFEVIEFRVNQPRIEDGRGFSSVDYVLTAFEVGELEIPSLELNVGREAGRLTTAAIPIVVSSVLDAEAGDIQEIKPPEEIPRNWWLLAPWLLAAAALAGLGYWAYRRYRRRAGAEPAGPPAEPPVPAHERAYQALQALEASSLLAEGEIKRYFTEASEIVRVYIEGRFGLVALELTSGEISSGLEARGVEREDLNLFEDLFRRADLVKFAKHRPGADACREMIPLARTIVDRTRPPDIEEMVAASPPGPDDLKESFANR